VDPTFDAAIPLLAHIEDPREEISIHHLLIHSDQMRNTWIHLFILPFVSDSGTEIRL